MNTAKKTPSIDPISDSTVALQTSRQPLLVTAAIVHDGQRLLIAQRRMDSKNEGGKWEFPGGKVEFCECPESCLVREIKEELDVEIEIERLFNVVSHVFEVDGLHRHIVLLCYVAKIKSQNGVQAIPKAIEVAEVRWVEIGDLDRFQFAAADINIVQKIKAENRI